MNKPAKIFAAMTLVSSIVVVVACGPSFPNIFLNTGSSYLLRSPFTFFAEELESENRESPSHSAVLREKSQTFEMQTLSAEIRDLDQALQESGIGETERASIVERYNAEREKFIKIDLVAKRRSGEGRGLWQPEELEFPAINIPMEVPTEFQKYLEGAGCYHRGEIEAAEKIWTELLELPAAERKYRSIWAAYMIGRIHEEQDADRVIEFMQMTRELADSGFEDSVGLAASSYGWEAKAYLQKNNVFNAILRYRDQHLTGDPTAIESIRIVCSQIARRGDEKELSHVAESAEVGRIYTSYLLSKRSSYLRDEGAAFFKPWLNAVEESGMMDGDQATELAVLSYRSGEIAVARKWLVWAPETSIVRKWLEAKLALRDGNQLKAAELYSSILSQLDTTAGEQEISKYQLRYDPYLPEFGPASSVIRAENGVLKLSSQDYVQALDSFLRSGYWYDAAYVAERILMTDELREYIDLNWSDSGNSKDIPVVLQNGMWNKEKHQIPKMVRYLLARRLMREGRFEEAAGYFPESLLLVLAQYRELLSQGNNEELPDEERGEALWEAAKIYRYQGIEMFGTEIGPDFQVSAGNWRHGVDDEMRFNFQLWEFAKPSLDEFIRYHDAAPSPDKKFHYRYIAADLAWEAARLLPDNDLRTARVLWEAGGWLKAKEPDAADRFYKALVNRNRQLEIGKHADNLRWFPRSDDPAWDASVEFPEK